MSVLLTIAALLVSATTALGAQDIVFAQVVHRHGSRSPILPKDASADSFAKICPTGCGILNPEGVDMLVKVGEFFKARYQVHPNIFPTTEYSFVDTYTRSTAVPRTVQSAVAFLKGVYPTSAVPPVVFNMPRIEDSDLLSDSWPNFFFYFQSSINKFYKQLAPRREELFTNAEMESMAAELHISELCSTPDDYVRCAVLFFDIAAAFEATGTLNTYPTVEANYPKIKQMAFDWFSLVYGWDASVPSDVERGSPGQPAVQKVIANMRDYINGKQSYKYIHYSAHDSTVSPMGTTLGYRGDDIILTGFGVFLGFELLQEGQGAAAKYFVRCVKGQPGQTPADHSVTSSSLPLSGIDADGKTYTVDPASATDYVPFDDFVRYVDSTAPKAANGQCSVPADQIKAMGCDAEGAPTSEICKMYRTQCTAEACPAGKMVDRDSLACVAARTASGNGDNTMTTANAGVMAMCTAFGGMLIGAGIMFAINFFRKKKAAGYERINDQA